MSLGVCQCNYSQYIVLVKLIQQGYAGSVFCLEIFLCLKASRHCVPAESNVIRFTVVKEWPLTETGMRKRTRHWFFSFAWEACSMLKVNVNILYC